jgi:2',3'-cyclic-nucleotide 2'-phosphodiesterase (5'-nucleotidase family)
MKSEIQRTVWFALLAAAVLPAQTRPLTILHTNDLHARFSPLDNRQGGFAYLATALRDARRDCKACILLNAGDMAQGSPVSTIFHGLPIFEVANLLHIDAATLGNHDFDYGWMQTRKFMATANYPVVSANMVDEKGETFTRHRSVMLKVNGLRVAVIGGMTEDLKTLSTPTLLGQWHAGPLLEAVRQEARRVRQDADLVVLLAHVTSNEERALLHEIPEVNVIVTGHIHSGLKEEVVEDHRLLVRVRGDAAELGRLDLEVNAKAKAIESWKWSRITIDSTKLQPAPDVAAAVKKWEDEVARRVDEPLAVSRHPFDKAGVRRLMERAMREQTGAQFAFVNAGGVRDVLPEGQLKVRHIWNIMPFDNVVVFGTFKGKDLPKAVVGDRQVEPEREYTLAVTDFTAANQGAPSQLQSTGLQFPNQGPLLRDLLVDWFRKQQTLD